MRIGVYIDGFNLYYGLFRYGPPDCKQYKWLNPVKVGQEMANRLKLSGTVMRVRYFTAPAKQNPNDPQQPLRQQILVRAMETLPEVTVHWGQHINTRKHGILVGDPGKTVQLFEAREENGSDVSLGAFLVRNAALGEIDVVLMVSNDPDLADVVSIVTGDFKTPVYTVSPQPNRNLSTKLRQRASGTIVMDAACLAVCQFPDVIFDAKGRRITKSAAWNITHNEITSTS